MAKLDPAKIKYIIREMKKDRAVSEIALETRVCGRRIRQVWAQYLQTGNIPELRTPGRPRAEMTDHMRMIVAEYFRQYGSGAATLEKLIDASHGIHIPHSTIRQIMVEGNMAVKQPGAPKRRRPWVRYERTYSNPMWHTDYKLLDDGRWLVACLDDASRFITGYGIFEHATGANALAVLRESIKKHGKPASILTDHGSQFYANESVAKKNRGVTQFENELVVLGIRHLLARVNHPQTNGKLERFHGELQRKLHRFEGDVGALAHWWNHIKPHRSLDWDSLETPARAFVRKMPAAGTTVTDCQTGEEYDVT